jgi:hypothetical protein
MYNNNPYKTQPFEKEEICQHEGFMQRVGLGINIHEGSSRQKPKVVFLR